MYIIQIIANFATPKKKEVYLIMIIVQVKEGENIERALKKFKRKFERTGTMKELRSRQQFTKPSVDRRQTKLKAAYSLKVLQQQES